MTEKPLQLNVMLDVEENPIILPSEHGDRIEPEDLADVETVGILQNGTASGLPVVIVRIRMKSGKIVLAQTSLKLFQMANAAFLGRYGDVT